MALAARIALALAVVAGAAGQSLDAGGCVQPTLLNVTGYSGSGALALTAAARAPAFTSAACGIIEVPTALVVLDLPMPGFTLTLDTCGSSFDTMVSVGTSCPDINDFYFGCTAASSNDDVAEGFCSPGASRVVLNATAARLFVLVQGYAGATGDVALRWSYSAPSMTPTATGTPSASGSPSPSETPGAPPSESATQTPRGPSPSGSETPSTSLTASGTPSYSPTASALPNCFSPAVLGGNFTAVGHGPSGATGSLRFGGLAAPFSGDYSAASPCAARSVYATYMARVAIDLGPQTPLGFGPLTVSLCGPGNTVFDTILHAGVGCPISTTAFGCIAQNDDAPGCGYRSQVTIPVIAQRFVYVIVNTLTTLSGNINVSWAYTGPTPSTSRTRSNSASRTYSPTQSLAPGFSASGTPGSTDSRTGSATRSESSSPSRTASDTGSDSATPSVSAFFTTSLTATPSGTASGSLTASASASLSVGAPPSASPTGAPPTPSESRSGVPSGSGTPSRTPTASGSPSPSPTPLCAGMTVLDAAGASGVAPAVFGGLPSEGGNGTAVSLMSCPLPTANSFGNVYAGSYIIWLVDLGAGTRLNGSLTVTTEGQSTDDTVLFVGTGCPAGNAAFGCIDGSDDASTSQSILTFRPQARRFYAIVSGYGGASGTSGLAWTYVPPTQTPTASATPTASLSVGASPSSTLTPTKSMTPTRSNTATASSTGAPCGAAAFQGAIPPSSADYATADVASGQTGPVTLQSTDTTSPSAASLVCGALTVTFNRQKHFWLLDLGALGLRPGGTLVVDTCFPETTLNTVLALSGPREVCPTSAALFGSPTNVCVANDNVTIGSPAWCTSRGGGYSAITLAPAATAARRVYYILVTLPNPVNQFRLPNNYNLRWTYTQPTASNTPTISLSSSSTPTPTGSSTSSPSATISFGAPPTPSSTPSPSSTASPSTGFTASPSGSPACAPSLPVAARVSGPNNTVLVVMAASGPSLTSVQAPCAGGGYGLQTTPHNLIFVDLGPDFVPGGALTATTALGGTALDTTLYVGAGCPTSVASFACLAGNDDIVSGTYQSTIALSGWSRRSFWIIASAYPGEVGTMFVRVSYVLPTPTPSGTGSASGTPLPSLSSGATPPPTGSATASASETATPTASVDFTVDPSETASVSATASGTATLTRVGTRTRTASTSRSASPTPTPSASAQCAAALPVARTLYGSAGAATLALVTNASSPLLEQLNGFSTCGGGSGITVSLGPKALVIVDLGRGSAAVPYGPGGFAPGPGGGLPLGYALNISTCARDTGTNASGFNTVLLVGYGCPTSAGAFRCAGTSDDAPPDYVGEGDESGCSVVTLRNVASWPVFVVVGGASGAVGAVAVRVTYALPSPSASPTSSNDPTATRTPSFTATGSPSATLSVGAPPSATPSGSATGSASFTPGYSFSSSPSQTGTPSATRTPGQCDAGVFGPAFRGVIVPGTAGAPRVLAGVLLNESTGDGLFPAAPCASGPDTLDNNDDLDDPYAGGLFLKHVYAVALPAGAALGGRLTVSACYGTNVLDAVVHVGRGCPTSAALFGCLAGGANTCGARQGRAELAAVTKRLYYVTIGGGVYGGTGAYSVAFAYATPVPSPSGMGSSSPSQSMGATPSETPPPTGTATETATPSPSLGYTESSTPSATPLPTSSSSPSTSFSETASVSASASETASVTATRSGTSSTSGTGSQTGTGSSSQTASSTGTPSATGTGSSSATGTGSSSATGTGSSSATGTGSSSATGTGSSSATGTGSSSATGTPSSSQTASSSETASASQTSSSSASHTSSGTPSRTPTASATGTKTRLPTPSATKTKTRTATRTKTKTRTRSKTKSRTKTRTRSSSRKRKLA